ncbi:iron(III) transporter, ATP-binding protein [Campylobacter iguaniorum]|uniref:Putative iron ABC transporter, ATP-binding protein n=1 Tax=Campylobacter iguaniorum TaxID=1244531 RepID=A0A076FHI2_9BACT|nr:ABC transporter ATP-binding protein [Campylobacter iguaniorum]AII15264.1 putative iron ABC transporter, ATP-binding protein [Campylobacter iguaniorum]ALV25190.1 iron(III) ABC transporter, ATP-binding protein [Campylobacter iguaniorum]ANE36386.1 iron(III) transporter, ATP-binding protein [Campylobacter iguaniorum]
MSFLHISELDFGYEKDKIINKFNLSLEKGQKLAICGASGSGKSTILRLISGFEMASSGRIILEGKDITFTPPNKRNIGYLFQDYALFPHLNVSENIAFGLKNIMKKNEIKDVVNRLLKVVSLESYASSYPHALSGGQQQRVALARALAPSPKLLLLDEPFSALDSHLKDEIRSEIKEILTSFEITSILVTHDQDDVEKFATSCIKLSA